MRLWQDGILALLAAIGLCSLIWAIVRPILFLPPRSRAALALITARGDGTTVEEQLRALTLLRREQGSIGEILLVDCGLSEEGARLCALLAREDRRISLCKPEEIPKYIR